VEVTYPPVYPRITQPPTMPEIDPQADYHNNQVQPTEDNTPQIIVDQPTTDNDSTEAQQGSIKPNDQIQNYQYWNALKIVCQSNGKGKPRYLIWWEDPTVPDSWSDADDVNDELKRVFYLTHTKTGSRRVHPLEDTAHPTLAIIQECDEFNLIQCDKLNFN